MQSSQGGVPFAQNPTRQRRGSPKATFGLPSLMVPHHCSLFCVSPGMIEIAKEHLGGKIISLFEGGYNLKVLQERVATHLAILCKYSTTCTQLQQLGQNER